MLSQHQTATHPWLSTGKVQLARATPSVETPDLLTNSRWQNPKGPRPPHWKHRQRWKRGFVVLDQGSRTNRETQTAGFLTRQTPETEIFKGRRLIQMVRSRLRHRPVGPVSLKQPEAISAKVQGQRARSFDGSRRRISVSHSFFPAEWSREEPFSHG